MLNRRSLLGVVGVLLPFLGRAQERCFPTPEGFLLCEDPLDPNHVRQLPDHAAPIQKMANEFAEAWNAWAKLRMETPPGAYSFTAKKQWDKVVEPAWKAVRLAVKNEV